MKSLFTKLVPFAVLMGLSDMAFATQPLPEPGAFELMGIVAAGIVFMNLKKRSKK
ncbi:MAG: hypothetical protein PHU14_01165 [Methylovulum sp.]|nr:hypothetical protein [Methylovulum sp.]